MDSLAYLRAAVDATQENDAATPQVMPTPRSSTDESVGFNERRPTEGTSTADSTSTSSPFLSKALSDYYAEGIWTDLIQEASRIQKETSVNRAILEVGMHRAIQSIQAARAGLITYGVEPSPVSFHRVRKAVSQLSTTQDGKDTASRIHIRHAAAGASTGDMIEFSGSGGTGDHVGTVDMWNMKEASKKQVDTAAASSSVIQVPTLRLDDLVYNDTEGTGFFLAKIDTQGFEPTVLSGLTKALAEHKIAYILMEYWPRGMDVLAKSMGTRDSDTCLAGDILQKYLANNGYQLYMLNTAAHPRAPSAWKTYRSTRPFSSGKNILQDHCQWYLDLETKVGNSDYHMGYWSDVVAVAPNAPALSTATKTGQLLSAK